MNCDDADASIVTDAARHATPAVDRHRQVSVVVVDVGPERAQRVDDRPHRAHPRLRVAVEPDRPVGECRHGRQEAHDGAGQAAVDA